MIIIAIEKMGKNLLDSRMKEEKKMKKREKRKKREKKRIITLIRKEVRIVIIHIGILIREKRNINSNIFSFTKSNILS